MNLKETLELIFKDMKEDCIYISFPEFVKIPKGTKQERDCLFIDHEYVDQTTGYCGDDYYGNMYFPFEDYYIKVEYTA